MRRRIIAIIVAATIACLLAFPAAWVWLGSDSGRQWLSASVASRSDGTVEIRGLSGHPLSQASAGAVLFSGDGVALTAESVALQWSPWSLLSGELAITALSAESVHLRIAAATGSKAATAPTLPMFAARLDLMHIAALTIERDGRAPISISDIRLDGLYLGESLAGHLQARMPDAGLNAVLSGQLKAWHLDGTLNSEAKGKIGLLLDGDHLQKGEVKLALESGYGTAQLESHWQRGKDALTLKGTMHLHADSGDVKAAWTLDTPLDFSRAALSTRAVLSSATRLERSLPLDISATWADEQLHAVIDESGYGLKLALTYAAAQLQGDLTLSKWDSPLKNAAGRLSGRVHGQWQVDAGLWRVQGDIDKGELAGLTARLKLAGHGDVASWQISQAEMHALGLDINLTGHGDKTQFKLIGSLHGKDIASALRFAGVKQQAAGQLQADVTVAGSYAAPQVSINAKARTVKLDAYAVDRASLSIQHGPVNGAYHLVARRIAMDGKQQMDMLDVTARLKSGKLDINLSTQGLLQSRARIMVGAADRDQRAVVISGARISYDSVSLLAADKVSVDLAGEHIHMPLSAMHLLGAKGSCAFDLTPEQVSGTLNIPDFNLTGKEAWLTGFSYQLAGIFGLKLSLAGHPQSPSVSIKLSAPQLRIRHPMFAGEKGQSLALSNVAVQLDYHQQQLNWQLHAKAPAQGSLESSGKLAMLFAMQPWQLSLPEEQQGAGSLLLHFARLSDMQSLLPRVDPIEGSSDITLNWSMPLAVHTLKGEGKITLDAIGIPEFGLVMNGALKATLSAGKPAVDLLLHNGDGELSITGPLDMDHRTIPDLKFNRFPLIQLPDQQLVVSGIIAASEKKKVSLIKGKLDVVRMRLEIPDPVAGPTKDLQWSDEQLTAAGKKHVPLSKLDVDLVLLADSEIYGRGMSLKPTGTLHLGGSVSKPKLTGVLDIVSGKIEFRSVKLEIQPESRVVFSGDSKRPSIYITAARKVGDITAGVIVDGPADQLTSQLYSAPVMSNAEIFSYIATGRPLASLGQDNISDMMTAAEFILGPGTMMQEVQTKVQQVTGLDVFEIGGDTAGGTIKAGRRLSDKVTLTVDQSVSKDATTALTLEYMLNRSLSIFARQTVNVAPTLGLRYSKEWVGKPKAAPVE